MKVWLVMGNCGDYYCDGMHVLAVSDNELGAKLLSAAATKKPRMATVKGEDYETSAYANITIDGPLEIGELIPESFRV